MSILTGSETWQISVSCHKGDVTEVMYVPTNLDVNDVRLFLINRGWASLTGGVWLCPEHKDTPL